MVVELHGAIYTIFEPNILGFQFFFSGLTAKPTNRPPVRDYDPDTPLSFVDAIILKNNLSTTRIGERGNHIQIKILGA
jgi:hypothetical protein